MISKKQGFTRKTPIESSCKKSAALWSLSPSVFVSK